MEKKLTIGGMSCQHCVHAVKEALNGIDGVTASDVTIGSADIRTDQASLSEEAIRAALDEEGFTLESVR